MGSLATEAAVYRPNNMILRPQSFYTFHRRVVFFFFIDRLQRFPGLWQGLQLGSISRHLASYAHEEMIQYLQHINDIWHKVTLEDFEVQRALDAKTVQNLELRVPACSTDQTMIKEMMESVGRHDGELFGNKNGGLAS